ncbi:MAG: hypothetical protein KDC95_15875 [Planctomycetes bacterium]|nr:hypothetical protein [Planctomycetota bacterium]
MTESSTSSPPGHRILLLARILTVASFMACVVQGFLYATRSTELQERSVQVGNERVNKIARELEVVLERIEGATRRFVSELETGTINTTNLLDRVEKDSYGEPYLLGLTVAYAKNAWPGKKLYAPFFDVASKRMVYCEDYYDYTDPAVRKDALWYQDALDTGERGVWIAAFGPAAGTTYVGYSLPFRNSAGQTIGIVNASVSMAKLQALLGRRFVGRLGAAVLIAEDGMLIAHPLFEHVRAGRRLASVAQRDRDIVLEDFASDHVAASEPRAFESLPSLRVDGSGLLYERQITNTGWRLGVAIFSNELDSNSTEMRRRRIAIALTLLLALTGGLAWMLRVDRLRDLPLWIFVVLVSLLSAGATALNWSWTLGDARNTDSFHDRNDDETVIADTAGLDAFLEARRNESKELHQPEPIVIPTGIEVQSLRFADGETVQVGGIVWQIYDDVRHEGLARTVQFGNLAPDPEGLSFEEASRTRSGSEERIVWHFRAVLRIRFDYELFPFDRQRVPIRLDHPSVDKTVILVPDLDRYRTLNTLGKPGLTDLVLPGWTVLGSYFGHTLEDSTVGFGEVSGRGAVSHLHFDVLVQRHVLTPFLSNIVPLLIVALLLHGVLIISSFHADKKQNTGFSTFGVLETSGAFFFAIVFLHIDLRGSLSSDTITYLEALFIVAYAMLILVALNSLLFRETDAVALLEYRDNLVAKLMFWPIVTGLVLAVTTAMFW